MRISGQSATAVHRPGTHGDPAIAGHARLEPIGTESFQELTYVDIDTFLAHPPWNTSTPGIP